ncbi:MAG: protease pro-enzyme activation domain-containing protein, partial [Candidatus Sulfotelmatobacter sp.]
LEKYIDQTTDKTSPNYHHWLTAVQIGRDYGPAQQDIDAVTGWLKAHGLKVNAVYPNGFLVDFSATAGQIRETFATEIHNLSINGEHHIANMRNPSLPAALAPVIIGIVSLNNFMPKPMLKHAGPNFTGASPCFLYTGTVCELLVPADLATLYNLSPLFTAGITGAGQTIALVEDSDLYNPASWTILRSTFGLSAYASGSLITVHPTPGTGVNNCADPGTGYTLAGEETNLDAQAATMMAPGAFIEIAACRDLSTEYGSDVALANIVNSSQPPSIISMSGGEAGWPGSPLNSFFYLVFQQAAAEGISVFLASSDAGAANDGPTDGLVVNEANTTPYDVAVGGTDLGDTYSHTSNQYWSPTNGSYYGSVLSYIPEIPWNSSCASVLYSAYFSGSPVTYGKNGFCNSIFASNNGLVNDEAGGGGKSSCATGTPSIPFVTSGSCAGYPKPSWQKVFGNPNDGVRDIPDISLFASPGAWGNYVVICNLDPNAAPEPDTCTGPPNTWAGYGGTSQSTPLMAGIQALVNQKKGTRQGNAAPILYQLAAAEYGKSGNANCNASLGKSVASSCIFYDITMGDIDTVCAGKLDCYLPSGSAGVLSISSRNYLPAYNAAKGWDFATGIGSVNATNLVNNWP